MTERKNSTNIVLRSDTIYNGKVIRVAKETIRLPDNREVIRDTIIHPGAVVIVPILASGEIVFIRQFRHPLRGWLLELPAGTLEADEDPLNCAKREIIEEIGYEAREWASLGQLIPAPGFCDEIQHCFVATSLEEKKADKDEDEFIETVLMDASQIEAAIHNASLIDGKSIAAFFKARLQGLV